MLAALSQSPRRLIPPKVFSTSTVPILFRNNLARHLPGDITQKHHQIISVSPGITSRGAPRCAPCASSPPMRRDMVLRKRRSTLRHHSEQTSCFGIIIRVTHSVLSLLLTLRNGVSQLPRRLMPPQVFSTSFLHLNGVDSLPR